MRAAQHTRFNTRPVQSTTVSQSFEAHPATDPVPSGVYTTRHPLLESPPPPARLVTALPHKIVIEPGLRRHTHRHPLLALSAGEYTHIGRACAVFCISVCPTPPRFIVIHLPSPLPRQLLTASLSLPRLPDSYTLVGTARPPSLTSPSVVNKQLSRFVVSGVHDLVLGPTSDTSHSSWPSEPLLPARRPSPHSASIALVSFYNSVNGHFSSTLSSDSTLDIVIVHLIILYQQLAQRNRNPSP